VAMSRAAGAAEQKARPGNRPRTAWSAASPGSTMCSPASTGSVEVRWEVQKAPTSGRQPLCTVHGPARAILTASAPR